MLSTFSVVIECEASFSVPALAGGAYRTSSNFNVDLSAQNRNNLQNYTAILESMHSILIILRVYYIEIGNYIPTITSNIGIAVISI
jgi:hypothetical protein